MLTRGAQDASIRFSSSPCPLEDDDCLEGGDQADTEHAVAGVRALIYTTILIADVASRSKGILRGQCRIETIVTGDREQILRQEVDSRRRDPPHQRGRNVVADLQITHPDKRAVLDVVAAERLAVRIVLVESRILRVQILDRKSVV